MIMRDCWFEVPGARPSFSQLAEDIERILHIAAGTVSLFYLNLTGIIGLNTGIPAFSAWDSIPRLEL